MKTDISSCDTFDRAQPAFANNNRRTLEQRSMRSPNSSIGPEQHRKVVWNKRIPKLQDEMAERLADISHSLASSKLEKMGDRMRGSLLRRGEPPTITELELSGEPLARLLALRNETMLCVGPLELDLIDRTAKRGDRPINLRPREVQLLKYMMQRSDKVPSRATLLKEVWQYKCLPLTNLVDVQMVLLPRKIDWTNEPPMIRSVRGVGFVLNATALSRGSSTRSAAGSIPAENLQGALDEV
jgi:DNA-binding winged helix-turn-helix (wHTH) protein